MQGGCERLRLHRQCERHRGHQSPAVQSYFVLEPELDPVLLALITAAPETVPWVHTFYLFSFIRGFMFSID